MELQKHLCACHFTWIINREGQKKYPCVVERPIYDMRVLRNHAPKFSCFPKCPWVWEIEQLQGELKSPFLHLWRFSFAGVTQGHIVNNRNFGGIWATGKNHWFVRSFVIYMWLLIVVWCYSAELDERWYCFGARTESKSEAAVQNEIKEF